MASTKDTIERGAPHPSLPRLTPTQDEQGTSSLHVARPKRPARFTEHLDDDDPANAFEYSETWRLLQESQTMSQTPEAGPSVPNRTIVQRTSRNEYRIMRRRGSPAALARPQTSSSPSLLSPTASQAPQSPSSSRSRVIDTPVEQDFESPIPGATPSSSLRASTTASRRACEELRPLRKSGMAVEGSSESDQVPRSAQKQPLHSATPRRKTPVTRNTDEPATFSPRASIPNITVSPPNQPASSSLETVGEVHFSDVHQSRQTVRTYSHPDGSVRRHLSFRRKPTQRGRAPPRSSEGPDDVDNGDLGDIDTNDDDDEDSAQVSDLTILAERIRRRMTDHFSSASASGWAPPPSEEDWEPYGYWEDGSFYEWRDIDWLGRPRRSVRSASPASSGKSNDKGKVSEGSLLSRVWRKLTVKDRKGKGKGKVDQNTKQPKYRNYDDYQMALQRHRQRREQEAIGGMRSEGSEAERDRLSTVGIRSASSGNDADNERDVDLGASMETHRPANHPGGEKKKKKKEKRLGFLGFFSRSCRKK
ncbi:hypothetical protein BR93DRAFT_299329 [Coniochaeta sp. PMI_546]|nr:hypothetical protein BR93DRAFT_299329 [Coniochaeta sp. PMI_546]